MFHHYIPFLEYSGKRMRLSTPIWSEIFIHQHRVRHPADIRQASGAPGMFLPAPALAHRLGRLYFRQNPAGAVPAHIVDDILFGMVEAVADPSRHGIAPLSKIYERVAPLRLKSSVKKADRNDG
jgi:hypothetical protein